MSNLLKMLMRGASGPLYSDDCFACHTYTGTGSTQTITNGIDLAGNGGLVWTKSRTSGLNHSLVSSVSTADSLLHSNTTVGDYSVAGGTGTTLNSNGFSVGSNAFANNSGDPYASWTFRKAPKFFDVVTYTGTGVARTVAHALGQAPGMIFVKAASTTGDWAVYHRANTANPETDYLLLNSTAATADDATYWNDTAPTDSVFTVGTNAAVNTNGATYVAYLFAHDTATDGLIQCGSFTVAGSTADITLGWEPQYVMMKRTDAAGEWYIFDTARGWTAPGSNGDNYLWAQSSAVEATSASTLGGPTATGFKFENITSTGDYIYLAIRRPNKPPTTGTQVFSPSTEVAQNVSTPPLSAHPDLIISKSRTTTSGWVFADALRGWNDSGCQALASDSTAAEATSTTTVKKSYPSGGWADYSTSPVDYLFRRAPGVFSTLCYTGTGSNKTESHDLAAAPEFWMVKGRSGATQWVIGSSLLANTEKIVMPSPAGKVTDATAWNSTYPTDTVLSLGTAAATNTNAATYVCYLWATKPGISKVFSYTGDGSAGKVINCGFTTGARFVLIVRTDTTGDVFVWDTVRGIIAGNDPHLSLNTISAEVTTDDSIDVDNSGFAINQVAATNINVTSATYIGVAYS